VRAKYTPVGITLDGWVGGWVGVGGERRNTHIHPPPIHTLTHPHPFFYLIDVTHEVENGPYFLSSQNFLQRYKSK
jgi:hypothetical protein